MAEPIYIVDPATRDVRHIEPTSFADLGVKERQELQEWVLQNPKVLGEDLLIISSEFDRFDKSARRLDVLALDRSGTLVVVELKLDVSGSLADLQAVRYAAFCSTMQSGDLVGELARHAGTGEEEAEATIRSFLGSDDLPDLAGEPRIILAAGSMHDQELTSCVLWLRRFGVDISCVELVPYTLPESQQIMLVPRVIIPLPEARDFVVSVERKAASHRQDEESRRGNEALWREIADRFNEFGLPFRSTGKSKTNFCQIVFGDSHVHYEWLLLKRKRSLAVALHFERASTADNDRLRQRITDARDVLCAGVSWPFEARRFGKKGAAVEFLLAFDEDTPPADIAPVAAETMRLLIERTWSLIRDEVKTRTEFKGFTPDE